MRLLPVILINLFQISVGFLAFLTTILGILAFDVSKLPLFLSNVPFLQNLGEITLLVIYGGILVLGMIAFAIKKAMSPVPHWGNRQSDYQKFKSLSLDNVVVIAGIPQTGKSTLISNLFFDISDQATTDDAEGVVWVHKRKKKQYHIGFIDLPRKDLARAKPVRKMSNSLIILVDNTIHEFSTKIDPERKQKHFELITGFGEILKSDGQCFRHTLIVFTKWDLWGEDRSAKNYMNEIIEHVKSEDFDGVFGKNVQSCTHSNRIDFLTSVDKIIDFSLKV